MIIHILMAFFATICFSVIFNAPKEELVFCGLIAAISRLLFEIFIYYDINNVILVTFTSAIVVTYLSRQLSYFRKVPSTIFLVPGILPLVPGSKIYFTVYYIVMDQANDAYYSAMASLSTSGVIAVGIIVVLTLPKKAFF